MIFLLFIEFLKIGSFTFGGGYGAIPLIFDIVLKNNWLNKDFLTYIIAISESTPGPIMVNLATYIGNIKAGFLGAIISTLSIILPAFFIIIFIYNLINKVINNKIIKNIISFLMPSITGIIFTTNLMLILDTIILSKNKLYFNFKNLFATLLLFTIFYLLRFIFKKKFSSIPFICISFIFGIIYYH